MGVLAVLSGIGIGFLGKSESSLSITWTVLRDKIRLAHENRSGPLEQPPS